MMNSRFEEMASLCLVKGNCWPSAWPETKRNIPKSIPCRLELRVQSLLHHMAIHKSTYGSQAALRASRQISHSKLSAGRSTRRGRNLKPTLGLKGLQVDY